MNKKRFPFLNGFRDIEGAQGGFDLVEDEIPDGLAGVPGFYIIESTDGFRFPYPKGSSNILYIGMAKDLRRRFREHRGMVTKLRDRDYGIKDRVVVSSKYQYMRRHGARVYYYDCRRYQVPKNMESWILFEFYRKYRAMPVGNGARSFGIDDI